MSNDNFYEFLLEVYTRMFEVMRDGAPIYVFHAGRESHNFILGLLNSGFKFSQILIWVKNTMVMGRNDYHFKHEPILYGWKPGAAHSWYSDRKQVTTWDFARPSRNAEHPTMKPIDLICYPINNSSKKGDLVVDLFLGSGSTLIASDKMHRKCYGMELDPKYCDVIIRRYQELTGQDAVLESTGKTFNSYVR